MCYGQEINSALRVARKQHRCDWCNEPIEPKTKYLRWFGIVEGDLSSSRQHPECEKASSEWSNKTGACWILGWGQPRGRIDWEMDDF